MANSKHTPVELALKALISPDDLSTDEQELYFEKLGESYRTASSIEDRFFADLRARGDFDQRKRTHGQHTATAV